jgi:murein L,D-transpeptidase YafK
LELLYRFLRITDPLDKEQRGAFLLSKASTLRRTKAALVNTSLARSATGWVRVVGSVVAMGIGASGSAHAVTIELKDVANDRIERQRAAAEGSLPLPGTPDLARLNDRLADKGLKPGAPIMLRAYKSESEFEVWVRKDDAYVLFATYPVCNWSGTLGPKQREGDKQTPEGFYTVTRAQMHHVGRWPRSMNLGFPNVYDKVQARNGSHILVHGGCSSVGCFAMTNAVVEEIYGLTEQSLKAGQNFVPVHVYPFRMTDANLESQKSSAWHPFWSNLKEGHDLFERTKRPPKVSVCDNRYKFADLAPEEGGDSGPLAVCGATNAALDSLEQLSPAARIQLSLEMNPVVEAPRSLPANSPLYVKRRSQNARAIAYQNQLRSLQANLGGAPSLEPQQAPHRLKAPQPPPCSTARASCRHFLAVREANAERRAVAANASRKHRNQQAAR